MHRRQRHALRRVRVRRPAVHQLRCRQLSGGRRHLHADHAHVRSEPVRRPGRDTEHLARLRCMFGAATALQCLDIAQATIPTVTRAPRLARRAFSARHRTAHICCRTRATAPCSSATAAITCTRSHHPPTRPQSSAAIVCVAACGISSCSCIEGDDPNCENCDGDASVCNECLDSFYLTDSNGCTATRLTCQPGSWESSTPTQTTPLICDPCMTGALRTAIDPRYDRR